MPDFVDSTNDRENHLQEIRIANIRAKQRELEPKGSCHWCGEVFSQGDPRLFCDTDCGSDWQRDRDRGR